MNNRPKIIALTLTVIIGAILFLWMLYAKVFISQEPQSWPPRHDGEVVMEEEFVDVIEDTRPAVRGNSEPAKAFNEAEADNKSDLAPESGTDLRNSGPTGEVPTTVTSKQPSPVVAEVKEPKKTGPSQEELDAQKEEEARRKATTAMQVFNNSSGNNNTTNNGETPGNSGAPSGTASNVNGTARVSVMGGWGMPSYAKVSTSLTGRICYEVIIDKNGNVKSLTFIAKNSKAPAGTDAALKKAIEKEIKSHRFTRPASAGPAPDEAKATITYIFEN